VFGEAGEWARAEEEYARAAKLEPGEDLVNWYRHQAAVGRVLGRTELADWYQKRLGTE
jgi:hypothetical protein